MLASLADLTAIGAIPDGQQITDKLGARALRLLELASAQVVAYSAFASEAALIAAVSSVQLTALAAVVAEVAGGRLNVTAAPSSNPYANQGIPTWSLLNRGHKAAIDDILRESRAGSASIESDRDPLSSTLGYQWALSQEFIL